MIAQLLQMLLDGRVIQALDAGYDAVIDVFAELVDGWLRTFCPAYALAMDGADTLAPDKMKALRRAAIEGVISELGLRQAIMDIIAQWQAAPGPVREAAKLYASAGVDFRMVWSDPNLANIASLVLNRLPDAYKLASDLATDMVNGNLHVADTTKWTLGFADTTNSSVANLLDKWKLGPIADIVRKYGGIVNHLTSQAVMIPADAVEHAWKDITSGDIDGILSDVIGIPVIKGAAQLVYAGGKAIANVAADAVAGPTGNRTADAIITGGLSELF